jgi:DNA-binding protein H-NS
MSTDKTVEQLDAEIKALIAKKNELQSKAKNDAIAEIKNLMAKSGITVADLVGKRAAKGTAAVSKGSRLAAGSYKNAATGEIYTYSGRGRRPLWIASLSEDEIAKCKVG